MEALISQIAWTPVVVSTVLAFGLGWLWYSPALFLKSWKAGLPYPPKWEAPMWMPMVAQLGATFILAILVSLSIKSGDVRNAAFIVIAIMGFTKANGLYAGKSMAAISVEVLYILAMGVLLAAVNLIL